MKTTQTETVEIEVPHAVQRLARQLEMDTVELIGKLLNTAVRDADYRLSEYGDPLTPFEGGYPISEAMNELTEAQIDALEAYGDDAQRVLFFHYARHAGHRPSPEWNDPVNIDLDEAQLVIAAG